MADGNGIDDKTPATVHKLMQERDVRLPKNPEAMWFVRELADYKMLLMAAVAELSRIETSVLESPDPPTSEVTAPLSLVVQQFGIGSTRLAYTINRKLDRRGKAR